ncbi:fibronectin type III-like domain-contianing protein [Vibrio sp. CDRSL-10 TSBA]
MSHRRRRFPGTDIDNDGLVDESHYNEGIYVGYRYYTSFDVDTAYPFGYGMSYTNFEYRHPTVVANTLGRKGKKGGLIQLSATIHNSGDVAGKEAAQVYVSAPQGKLDKPVIELKAFAKTSLLQPGQNAKLAFNIPARDLASFDASRNEWIIEPGTYQVYIAPSSDVNGKLNGTATAPVTFTVSKEIVVSETTPGALALPQGVTTAGLITVAK